MNGYLSFTWLRALLSSAGSWRKIQLLFRWKSEEFLKYWVRDTKPRILKRSTEIIDLKVHTAACINFLSVDCTSTLVILMPCLSAINNNAYGFRWNPHDLPKPNFAGQSVHPHPPKKVKILGLQRLGLNQRC